MLQRNSTGKRKRAGDFDVEIKCYMILQPSEKDEFVQSIKQLYQSESLCDVTFRVGDQLFHAHRIVLAAANRLSDVLFFLFLCNSTAVISRSRRDSHRAVIMT